MKILIIGAGQVGYFLCERLSLEGHEVTLIDRSQENLRRAQDRLNVLGIAGNGASAETLEQAGRRESRASSTAVAAGFSPRRSSASTC
jgi:trk system potassium uptake protein TrkA